MELPTTRSSQTGYNPGETCTYKFEIYKGLGTPPDIIALELPYSSVVMGCIATAHQLLNGEESVLSSVTNVSSDGPAIDAKAYFSIPWGRALTDKGWTLRKLSQVNARIEKALSEPAGTYSPVALSELLGMRLALMGVLGEETEVQ